MHVVHGARLILCSAVMGIAGLAGSAVVSGCDSDEPLAVECPESAGPFKLADSRITGTFAFDPPVDPLPRGQTIFISGTAHHEDGLAIREIRVAGVAAARDEFNFARWSATVSYEAIVTASTTSAESQVQIEAVAIDACGKRYPFAVGVVTVDPSPDIDVQGLSVTVEYPGNGTFVPADGRAPAIVRITGTGRAAGAVVSVTADRGDLRGLDEEGKVVLAAPSGETGTAQATLLFYGTESGTAIVAATVEDKVAVALVKAEGPPSLAPGSATLGPGASIEVEVRGASAISCSATVSDDVQVLYAGEALGASPTAIEADEGGRRVLVVQTAAEPVDSTAEVTVTCTDAFGQVGGGVYRLGEATFPGGGGEEPPPDEGF